MNRIKQASNVTVYTLAAVWALSPVVLLVQIIEKRAA